MEMRVILCEFGPDGGACLFRDPDELLVVERPDEVAPALARLETRRRAAEVTSVAAPACRAFTLSRCGWQRFW